MLKKIAISVAVFIIAILVFLFVQLNRLETKVEQQLAKYHISTNDIQLSLFPTPRIELNQIQYQQLTADKLTVVLPLESLIVYNYAFKVKIDNFKTSKNNENPINLDLYASNFSLNDKNEILTEHIKINAEFAKPIYADNKTFEIEFFKGSLQMTQENEYNLIVDHLSINQQKIGYLEAQLDLNPERQKVLAHFDNGELSYRQLNPDLSEIKLNGQQFPIERLFAIFKFPNTVTGNASFDIGLLIDSSKIENGHFEFTARNGEIIGMDLLSIAAQYLPINYDQQDLADKNLNTKYDEFTSQFKLSGSNIELEKIFLKMTALSLQGNGVMNLQNMQCDVNVELRANNEKYDALALPVHFFDRCDSPQYEIKFNKNFRNQLKEFIREKLR